jgi:hypothetical protein
VNPAEAFSAEVAMTSLTIAIDRNNHCCMGKLYPSASGRAGFTRPNSEV